MVDGEAGDFFHRTKFSFSCVKPYREADGGPGGRFMYNRQYIPPGRKRQEPPAGAQKNCKICKKGLHFPEKSHILFYETKTEYEKGVV